MKRLIITLALILCTGIMSAENSKKNFGVDERFELTSIVWKLADAPEYNACDVPVYTKAIEKHFNRYKKHPLIQHCKEIRAEYGVAYDAIANSTAYIQIKDGHVGIIDGFSADSVSGTVDYRWKPKAFAKYVSLLDDFYQKSKFDKFFASQKHIYDEAEASFDKIVMSSDVGMPWFKSFFGEEPSSYQIYLCINNGPSNYGGTDNSGADVAAVVGCCFSNGDATATYTKSAMHIVLHEFMHTFANPIAAKYEKESDPITEKIYPHISRQLSEGAYGRGAIMLEWFTRIATIVYLRDDGSTEAVERMIMSDSIRGFVWQRDAIAFMDKFDNNRDKYPTFESFAPELITFLEGVSNNMDKYMAAPIDTAYSVPEIVCISPSPNTVLRYRDIDTLVVTVKFSEPMKYSICMGPLSKKYDQEEVIEIMQKYDKTKDLRSNMTWIDNKTLQLSFPKEYMKKLAFNGFFLQAWAIISVNDIPIKEDVNIEYLLVR